MTENEKVLDEIRKRVKKLEEEVNTLQARVEMLTSTTRPNKPQKIYHLGE